MDENSSALLVLTGITLLLFSFLPWCLFQGGRLLGACEEAAAGGRQGVHGLPRQVRQGQHPRQDHQEGTAAVLTAVLSCLCRFTSVSGNNIIG